MRCVCTLSAFGSALLFTLWGPAAWRMLSGAALVMALVIGPAHIAEVNPASTLWSARGWSTGAPSTWPTAISTGS